MATSREHFTFFFRSAIAFSFVHIGARRRLSPIMRAFARFGNEAITKPVSSVARLSSKMLDRAGIHPHNGGRKPALSASQGDASKT